MIKEGLYELSEQYVALQEMMYDPEVDERGGHKAKQDLCGWNRGRK